MNPRISNLLVLVALNLLFHGVATAESVYDPAAASLPDRTIAVFDVFGPDGSFEQQVTVQGEGDYFTDEFQLAGDCLYVVRGESDDYRLPPEERDIQAPPYAVVCYRLPLDR